MIKPKFTVDFNLEFSSYDVMFNGEIVGDFTIGDDYINFFGANPEHMPVRLTLDHVNQLHEILSEK